MSAPALFVFWLIFVGTFSRWEMAAGLAVAVAGGTAICVVQHADDAHFRPRLHDVAQIVYLPWLIAQGTAVILFVAARDLFGGPKAVSAFRVVPFAAGDLYDPCDTARRVLAITYTTMTPSTVVIGLNTRENQLLYHEIQRSEVSAPTRNLGAVA